MSRDIRGDEVSHLTQPVPLSTLSLAPPSRKAPHPAPGTPPHTAMRHFCTPETGVPKCTLAVADLHRTPSWALGLEQSCLENAFPSSREPVTASRILGIKPSARIYLHSPHTAPVPSRVLSSLLLSVHYIRARNRSGGDLAPTREGAPSTLGVFIVSLLSTERHSWQQ